MLSAPVTPRIEALMRLLARRQPGFMPSEVVAHVHAGFMECGARSRVLEALTQPIEALGTVVPRADDYAVSNRLFALAGGFERARATGAEVSSRDLRLLVRALEDCLSAAFDVEGLLDVPPAHFDGERAAEAALPPPDGATPDDAA